MIVFLIVIGFALSIDIVSKKWAIKNLRVGEKKEVLKNRFYFWHIKNHGIAYNKLGKYPHWIVTTSAVMICALFFSIFPLLKDGKKVWRIFFSGLFFGGALGNFFERVRKKQVTDFIYIKGKNLPIFNFADIFIVLGALFSVIDSIFGNEN